MHVGKSAQFLVRKLWCFFFHYSSIELNSEHVENSMKIQCWKYRMHVGKSVQVLVRKLLYFFYIYSSIPINVGKGNKNKSTMSRKKPDKSLHTFCPRLSAMFPDWVFFQGNLSQLENQTSLHGMILFWTTKVCLKYPWLSWIFQWYHEYKNLYSWWFETLLVYKDTHDLEIQNVQTIPLIHILTLNVFLHY